MIDQPFIDEQIREIARLGAECAKRQAENEQLRLALERVRAEVIPDMTWQSTIKALEAVGRIAAEAIAGESPA